MKKRREKIPNCDVLFVGVVFSNDGLEDVEIGVELTIILVSIVLVG